jgi:hypothetical protein
VVLVIAIELTFYFVARATAACAVRATSLDHEVIDHTVKIKAVIKAAFRKLYKIGNGIGSVFVVKVHLHGAFLCLDLCSGHSRIKVSKAKEKR